MPKGHDIDTSTATKLCPGCNTEKPWDDFHKSRSTVHGYQVYCKACAYRRHAKYRLARKPYFAEMQRKKRRKNPERHRDYNLKANYGIPFGTYAALFAKQDGRCAICGTNKPGRHDRFHVDHCHDTGAIRGLLCHGCNVSIGHFNHSPAILRAAAAYLETAISPPPRWRVIIRMMC